MTEDVNPLEPPSLVEAIAEALRSLDRVEPSIGTLELLN